MTRQSDTIMNLIVRDNGKGFDQDTEGEGSSGLGRSLMDAFVRQLHGELQISSANGTELQVSFRCPLARSATPVAAGAVH